MFTVYVLYSQKHDVIYIGYTSNLINRFYSHNSLGKSGYTTRYRPWQVIYCEHYSKKADAIKREKQLKSGKGRSWIHANINKHLEKHGYIF